MVERWLVVIEQQKLIFVLADISNIKFKILNEKNQNSLEEKKNRNSE